MSSTTNLENRSLLHGFEKGGFFDLGHPLLNRIAESFVKAAGIGAVQAVAREAYFTASENAGGDTTSIPPEITGPRKNRFPDIRGENNRKSVEALVKSTGKESMQWGVAAGMYSGLTYGLKEVRGVHDWVRFPRCMHGRIFPPKCLVYAHLLVVHPFGLKILLGYITP